MSKVIGPVQYKGKTVGPVQFDPRDIGHLGPHQPQRNLGPFEDRAPREVDARVKPGLPRLNSAHELATGLIGAWPMAQLTGSTIEDLTGVQGEGSLMESGSGSSYGWGYVPSVGPALALDAYGGSNFHGVAAGTYDNAGGLLTVAALVRVDSDETLNKQIICADSNNISLRAFQFRVNTSGQAEFIGFVSGVPVIVAGTTDIRDDEWHWVAATVDGTNCCVYVDGIQEISSAHGAIDNDNAYLAFGARRDNSTTLVDGLNGDLADARIWSRALSSAEIACMYADPWGLYRVTKKPDYPVLDTSNPLSDSLVVELPLHEGSGTDTSDISGNENDGTASAANWNTDTEVGPYWENPTSGTDYIQVPNSSGISSISDKLTLACWVKISSTTSSQGYIVGCRTSGTSGFGIHAGLSGTQPLQGAVFTDPSGYGTATGTSDGRDGVWHHVAMTYDGATIKFYQDGILEGETSHTGTINCAADLFVAQRASSSYPLEDAAVARVQLFNRALSASDVADLAEDPWLLYLEGDAPTGTSVTVTPSTAELGVFASADASVSISNSISASVAGLVVSGYAASVISENYLGLLHLDPGPGFHEYRIFGISGSISGSYSDIVSVEFAAGTGSYSTIITGSTLNTVIQSNAPTVVGDAGISVTVDGIGISSNPPIVIGAASVFTTTESVAVSVGTVTVSAAAIVTVSTVNVGVGAGTASVVGAGNAVIQTTAANLAASANAPAVATGTAVAVTTVSLGLSINPTSTSGSGTITVTPTTASSVLSISDPAILSGTTVATTTNSLSVGANPAIVLGSGQIVAATSAGNLAVSVNPPTVATSVAVTATTSTASLAVGLSAPAVATQVFNTVSATTASIKLFVPDSTAAVGSTVSTTSIGTVLSVSDASVVIISEGTTVVDAGLLSLGINDPTVVTVRYITATTTTASMAVGAGTVLVEDSISATATPSTASVKLYTSAVEVVAPKQVSVSSANAALNTGTPTVSAIKNVTVAATTVGLSLGSNSVTTTGAQTVTVSATTSSLSIFARLASASAKVNVTPQPTTASLTTNVLDPIVDTSNVVIRVEASGLSLNISSIAIESVIADSAELTELESPSVDPTYKRDTGRSKTVHSDINLREDFNIISAGGSEWIGLRIANKNMKCSCGIGCSRCLGTGYQFTDYLTKARVTKYSPGFMLDSTIGQLSTSKIKVYLPSNRIVNKGDMILTLDINNNTSILNQPIRINRQYIVAGVSRHTDEKGRILYYQVIAEERNTTDYVRN